MDRTAEFCPRRSTCRLKRLHGPTLGGVLFRAISSPVDIPTSTRRSIGLRQGPHETEETKARCVAGAVCWFCTSIRALTGRRPVEDGREACPAAPFFFECISHPSLYLIVRVSCDGRPLDFHLRHRVATSRANSPFLGILSFKDARQGGGIADFEPVESACTKMHGLR